MISKKKVYLAHRIVDYTKRGYIYVVILYYVVLMSTKI